MPETEFEVMRDEKLNVTRPDAIGPYPVTREIARGGMGVVYLAEDPKLKRQVAIKLLPEEFARNEESRARFEREAQLLAAINNPNIATIHSLEESDGHHYLTMEFIPGENLAERLVDSKLSLDDTLAITRQIATALETAHRRDIVHRDLKPLNVMVTPENAVKVLDFGLAKMKSEQEGPVPTSGEALSKPGIMFGTLGYMSPEQIRGLDVDHRADIWAFGCIVFECLARRPAFDGETPADRIRATLGSNPAWHALPDDTPARLSELLSSCLAKEADERLDSIAVARKELEELIALRAMASVTRKAPDRPIDAKGNLPLLLSSFIGRDRVLPSIRELIGSKRLVTLTGAGGCGKTRLALESARGVGEIAPDGVWFVELASLGDPDRLPQVVADTLEIKEESGRPLLDTIAEQISGQRLLLILDNCEHLLDACVKLVESLLRTHTALRIVSTSREPLGIPGETIYRVPSMDVPLEDSALAVDQMLATDAVRLFVERVRAANTEFEFTDENADGIARICRRLDGIPLAIELAAARTAVLAVDEIARRLDDRFRLLTAGNKTALPRHQTLRGLIDWSYGLLTPSEQSLLRRLSIFSGGWTLDAANTIGAGFNIEDWEVLDLLSQLVAKSLVEMDVEGGQGTGRARYRMLETVREYAREHLVRSEEAADIRLRHRDHFVSLAEEGERNLTGPDQASWLSRLETEHENFRLALDSCDGGDEDAQCGLRLAGALGRYWQVRGYWTEGRRACARILACPEGRRRTDARGKTLNWAGNLTYMQGDAEQARAYHEESLAIRKELGDWEGVAETLSNMGNVAFMQGDSGRAQELFEESLEIRRRIDDRRGVAVSLNNLGVVAERNADYARALKYFEESLVIEREIADRWGIALSLHNVALVAMRDRSYRKARTYSAESLAIARELGDQSCIAQAVDCLGMISHRQGDFDEARLHFEEGLAIQRQLGNQWGIAEVLNNLGQTFVRQGLHGDARRQHAESITVSREIENYQGVATSLGSFGLLAVVTGELRRAACLLGAAKALHKQINSPVPSDTQEEIDVTLERLVKTLGDAAFAEAWAEGQAMPLEHAVAYALENDTPED